MYSFSVKLPGCKQSIKQFDLFCDHCLKLLNNPKHRKILFAIHEAIINAVAIHEQEFNELIEPKPITVDIFANCNEVVIKVIDYGKGLTKKQFQDYIAAAKNNPFFERGRGLLFIEKFADQLQFEHLVDGKFCVTFKFLNE